MSVCIYVIRQDISTRRLAEQTKSCKCNRCWNDL